MRIERWFWLPIFCVVSLLMHLTLAMVTRGGPLHDRPQEAPSIEVAFEPAVVAPRPKVEKKRPAPKLRPSVVHGPRPAAVTPFRVAGIRRVVTARRTFVTAPRKTDGVSLSPSPHPKAAAVELSDKIKSETPAGTHRAEETSTALPSLRPHRQDPNLVEGGGSPSPAPVPGGHGGLNTPENPKEDVLYTGGGAGNKLPAVNPQIGGGGGRSILSVTGANPLGDGIPDDKPGIGPGHGGGLGSGSGGGIGFARGKGIGAQADGKAVIGSLRRKPGRGIGAALAGNEVGTKAPGGGRGRGAELPGTGGAGTGYGRGHGVGLGDGSDDAAPVARARGVPFGDIARLLGGGNGGDRNTGPGRGAVFGTRVAGGNEGPIHIVYALDISGSMRDGHKLEKAKDALKRALGTLRRYDTFNIITFKEDASTFRVDSVQATPANIANARIFVDDIRTGNGTNISRALELALDMNGITEIYLMSDGEPNGGIADFGELRRFVRDRNKKQITITTLALGLGENFPGMRLLKGIAEDNNGKFAYADLAQVATPPR